jgi:hypothetical protein
MKKIILIVSIVLIGIIGLGVLSYNQGWIPFFVSDEEIISTMIEKMGENKSWHSDLDIEMEIKGIQGQEEKKVNVILNIEGDIDRTDIENPKSAVNLDAELKMEGMSFSLGGETKILGKKDIYFRLTTIPALPFLDILGLNLDELKSQWIRIDEEYLKESPDENEEMMKKLEELFKGKEFLRIDKKLPDEKNNGINNYHYLISLDKTELKKIIPEIVKISMESNLGSEYLSGLEKEKTLEEASNNINEFFDKIGDINFEVWVGKKDKLLYRLKTEKEIDISKFYDEESLDQGLKGSINIKLELNFSDFNKEVKIEAPKEFKSINEVFPFIGTMGGQVLGEQILKEQILGR